MIKDQVALNIDQALDTAITKLAKGKTVLDLGGYRGRECAVALEAGATSAVCVDDESWRTYDRWADTDIYPNVKYVKGNFMNYKESADIVVLKNVIYHTRTPWAVLEHCRALTKETLLLATSYVEGEEAMWKVYRPYEGHPVSWTVAWRPTKKGLIKLLEATGFGNIEMLCEDDHGSLALRATPGELPIGFGERI